MNRTRSKSIVRGAGILWALFGAGALVVALAYFLHRYPLTIAESSNPEAPATFDLTDRGAQVVLWVDTALIREGWSHGALSTADFSFGWANTLEQEFGFYDVRDISSIDSAHPITAKVAVFSVSALAGISQMDNGVKFVRDFIGLGGLALLDYPDSATLAKIAPGARFVESPRRKLARGELQALLSSTDINQTGVTLPDSLPLFSKLRDYDGDTKFESASFDSASLGGAFTSLTLENGLALVTRWDFGRWVTLTQQGLPNEQLRTINRYAEFGHSANLEANDLVADSLYVNASYPWVDIVEKIAGNVLASLGQAPRWFTAPNASSGIFMMTHDDEGLGDAGVWMNEYEALHGYVSTSFLMLSEKLSATGVQSTLSHGGDVGLHWNRFDRKDKGAFETLGVGRWRPLLRKRNLQSQKNWLDSLGVQTTCNRNHYFLWDEDPYRIFRNLRAAGFTMDYSYGPDLHDKGYLFGTSFPFHPLDNNGASFNLQETPVTWTENFAGADSVWTGNILSDNASELHGVINALYHNNTFSWAPDYSVYTSWRRSYTMAQESNHQLFTASELERFLRARRNSAFSWESDSETEEVFCETTDSTLALIAPYLTFARPEISLHGATPDSNSEPARIDTVTVLGVAYWRVALPEGKFLLSFPWRDDINRGER